MFYRGGYDSEDPPEDPLATPLDEREASKMNHAVRAKQQADIVAMPAPDDTTPVPADFAAGSEHRRIPSQNVGLSGGAELPFGQSAVAARQPDSAQGSRRTLKSILKSGGKVCRCVCWSTLLERNELLPLSEDTLIS